MDGSPASNRRAALVAMGTDAGSRRWPIGARLGEQFWMSGGPVWGVVRRRERPCTNSLAASASPLPGPSRQPVVRALANTPCTYWLAADAPPLPGPSWRRVVTAPAKTPCTNSLVADAPPLPGPSRWRILTGLANTPCTCSFVAVAPRLPAPSRQPVVTGRSPRAHAPVPGSRRATPRRTMSQRRRQPVPSGPRFPVAEVTDNRAIRIDAASAGPSR